jgi:hypothetical protein
MFMYASANIKHEGIRITKGKLFFVPDSCLIPRKQLPFKKIRQVSWLVSLQRLPILKNRQWH